MVKIAPFGGGERWIGESRERVGSGESAEGFERGGSGSAWRGVGLPERSLPQERGRLEVTMAVKASFKELGRLVVVLLRATGYLLGSGLNRSGTAFEGRIFQKRLECRYLYRFAGEKTLAERKAGVKTVEKVNRCRSSGYQCSMLKARIMS